MALLTTSLRITYLLMYRSRREHLHLVYDRATADVEGCRGHRAGQVGGSEGGHIAYILKRRCPLEHRLPDDHFGDTLAPIEALRDRLGHPARLQRHCADTMRSELGGQLAAQGLHRVECDLESSQVVVRHRIPVAAEKENHPRSLRDHVPCCCPGGQELCPHGGHDRPLEVFEGHLGERRPLDVPDRDEVEGDVDTSSARGHSVSVLVDGLLVEGIDLRRLGPSSSGADLLGHLLEALKGTTGEEDLGPLAGEGTGDRTTNLSSASVDDGVLVLEQHSRPPYPSGCGHLVRAYGKRPEFELAKEQLANLHRDTARSLRTQPP